MVNFFIDSLRITELQYKNYQREISQTVILRRSSFADRHALIKDNLEMDKKGLLKDLSYSITERKQHNSTLC